MYRVFILALVACNERAPAPPAQGSASGSALSCIADRVDPHDRVWVRRTNCAGPDETCTRDCEANDASACMSIAVALEPDPAQRDNANALFIRACELGLIAGCTNYAGFLWSSNRGNAASACAQALFAKTCAVKDPFGCGMLGRMLIDDAKTPIEIAAGREKLEAACDELNGFPCRVLALQLESDKLGAYDPAQLGVLLARACGGGDKAACGSPPSVRATFGQ